MPEIEPWQYRRLLHFHYERDARRVESHAYGMTREGVEILNTYQIAGGSRAKVKSREYSGWKIYRVEDVKRLKVLPEGFQKPRPDYMRNDHALVRIFRHP